MPHPTMDVLAIAFSVFRQYDSQYYRADHTMIDPDTNERIPPNGHAVRQYLRSDNPTRDVTEQDRAAAEDAVRHLKGYSFKALAGTLNSFQADVLRAVLGETVTNREIGLVAFVPKLIQRDGIEAQLKKVARDAQFDPSVRRVEGSVQVVTSEYKFEYGRYIVNGYLTLQSGEGPFAVAFWTGENLTPNTTAKIKGRVKQIRRDGIVQLNYVKVAERG